jgi:hypothetical protein
MMPEPHVQRWTDAMPLRTVDGMTDPCPERDNDGHCHCDRVDHGKIEVSREPRYAIRTERLAD